MKKINSSQDLQTAIFMLEQKRNAQRKEIENEVEQIHKRLSVANVFKSTLRNIVGGDSIGTKAASSALGFGSGLIAQRLVAGKSAGIFKRLLGTLVQIAVTGLVAKNSDKAVSKGVEIGKKVFG